MKRFTAVLLILMTLILSIPTLSIEADAAFAGEDKVTVVLDPGHGGANIGTAARGVGEKTYTMKLANLIYNKLMANGNFNVYMTRSGDYDLELYQRCEVANSYNADIIISIHFDGNPVQSLNGVTTFTSVLDKYSAVPLAQSIANNISAATGLKNNGVVRRQDNEGHYWNAERQWDLQDPSLGVLSDYYGIPTWAANFGMKSIIVEHGFFSNANDVNIILTDGAFEKMAEAEANAIIDYYTNHTHNYAAIPVRDYPSCCMYTGKQSVHCQTCGHRKNVTSLDPAPDNHYWVAKSQTPAACGVDGVTVYECRVTEKLAARKWTGELHTKTVITPAPSDHTMEMTENVKATHTVDGYQTFKCKTCSYSFKDIIKAEGHTYEFVGYTAPTCEESGGNSYKCTGCSSAYTDTEAALGHNYEYSENVDPTCTADGKKKGTCLTCSKELDEVILKLGHMLSIKEEIAATCTERGKKQSVCTVCGYEENEDTPPLDHSFEEAILDEATCEKAGKRVLKCTVCSHTEEKAIEASGHKKSEKATVIKKSGTFSAGEVSYVCENGCGKIFIEKTEPKLSKTASILLFSGTGAFALALSALLAVLIIKRRKGSHTLEEKGTETPATEKIEMKIK